MLLRLVPKPKEKLNGTEYLRGKAYHEAQREQSYRAETATSHTAGTGADPVSCTYSHGFQRDCQRTQACQRLCVGAQHTNQDTCSKPSSCWPYWSQLRLASSVCTGHWTFDSCLCWRSQRKALPETNLGYMSALYGRQRCVDEGRDSVRTLDVHLERTHASLRWRTALIAGKAAMFAGFGVTIWSCDIQLL